MPSDAWEELLRTLKGFEIFCGRLSGKASMLDVYYAHWYVIEWICLRETLSLERRCYYCLSSTPHRFQPSPDAGPDWQCSQCGEPNSDAATGAGEKL